MAPARFCPTLSKSMLLFCTADACKSPREKVYGDFSVPVQLDSVLFWLLKKKLLKLWLQIVQITFCTFKNIKKHIPFICRELYFAAVLQVITQDFAHVGYQYQITAILSMFLILYREVIVSIQCITQPSSCGVDMCWEWLLLVLCRTWHLAQGCVVCYGTG